MTSSEDDSSPSTYAEIIAAAGEASSKSVFYGAALRCIARAFRGPYAAIYVRLDSQVIEDDCHHGPTDPGFWKPAVQGYLLDSLAEGRARARLLSARKADLRIGLFSVPLHDPRGTHVGALALAVQITDTDARKPLAILESLAALTTYVADTVGPTAVRPEADLRRSGEALSRAASFESPAHLAFSLTNNLRGKLGCEQVALGLVRRQRVQILSVSGLDDVHRQSPGAVRLQAAMEECADFGRPLVYQAGDTWDDEPSENFRLHKRWHESARGASVASIPLRVADTTIAVVSLRRGASEPFTTEQIARIHAVIEPFAAAMQLVIQARRGVLRHARDRAGEALAALMRPGRIGRKLTLGAGVLFALWFLFGTMPYALTAPAVLASAEVRQVAAPSDGVLVEVLVTAGDRVRAGDLLCGFDRTPLELERAQLDAQRGVAEQERLRALAADAPVEAELARLREKLFDAKLEMLLRRLERTSIRSPIDGIVIAGDLRTRVDSVLSRGEPLFEIAPLAHWTLEIEVPESASSDVRSGLDARFASYAMPDRTKPFRLRRVRPRAEVRTGANVYVAEADALEAADWMRPGTQGFARIDVGRKRVWWVALHRIIDGLRMSFWL